ncbi:hypothetical protein [Ferruginibacter sp.]|uniref:hypothetical protein n=1 Tax=Ferruginibacter sp. TaxID=1940288 RepID=UPI002657FB47|nr:hypothetical protein [Ferruginibacter sp.]
MKNYKSGFSLLGAGVAILLLCTGCTKDFGNINTNPSNVTTPDPKFLMTYTEDKLSVNGTEWVWESFEQLFRFTQHFTSSPYEIISVLT